MPFRLDINGVQSQSLLRRGGDASPPTFDLARNQRPRMQFDIETDTPPAKRVPVVFYDKAGTTKKIGGIVERRTALHQGGPECYRIEVLGFSRYYDFCYWTKQYTADTTLKAVLADLVTDKLAAYGIGLDAGQVDGPTLTAPFGWVNRKAADVIKDLVEQTGYMDDTSAELKLRMFAPGTATYGTTITNLNASRVSVDDSTQVPATRVICIFGPSGTQLTSQRWVANGTDTSWVTDIPAAAGPTLLEVDDGVTPFLATVGAGGMFEFNVATSTLSVGTYGTPASGVILTIGPTVAFPGVEGYLGLYPFTIVKDSLATPVIETVLTFPSITEYAQADETATEQLAQTDQDPRVFSIDTLLDNITPGVSLPVNVAEVDAASTSGIVTRVRATLNTDLFWEYTVEAEETSASLQKDPLSRLKQVIGQSAAGSVVLSGAYGGGGSTTVLSSPFPLGGSRENSWPVGTTGAPVIDWMPFVAQAAMSVRVRVVMKVFDGDVEATPILQVYDGDTMAWVTHATGVASSSTTGDEQTFIAALSAGEKYRLWHVTDTAGAESACIGQLENLA
jgi:hypothetical protein